MARYLSVLTPSIPFCPLFHRFSVSLYRSCRPRPPLLLLPCLHSTSKSIRPAARPLFPLFRKLSDALSRTTYMSTPSSSTEDFDSCLIHVSHTVTWDTWIFSCFPSWLGTTADISAHKEGYKTCSWNKTFRTGPTYIWYNTRNLFIVFQTLSILIYIIHFYLLWKSKM